MKFEAEIMKIKREDGWGESENEIGRYGLGERNENGDG